VASHSPCAPSSDAPRHGDPGEATPRCISGMRQQIPRAQKENVSTSFGRTEMILESVGPRAFETRARQKEVRLTAWRKVAFLLLMSIPMAAIASEAKKISQEELLRRTQELFDAVTAGDPAPFQRYFAEDAVFFDEKGRNLDKNALVRDIVPLPKGYSGSIKVGKSQSRIIGNTAILSYDLDEAETIFGQHLTARYHSTDTWMYRNGQWQIIASQVFRYYEDPAVGESDPKLVDLYVGIYELAPGITMQIAKEDHKLYSQRAGRPREQLLPEATGIFFRKGIEGRRLFHITAGGTVDYLIDRRNNEDVIWKKIE
jgi:Domain of unknown function (DUF4440)